MDHDHLQTHRTYIQSEADVHCAVMQVYAMLVSIHALPTVATEVATVTSELAMNIVKYAGCGGTIVVTMEKHGRRYIDIVAEDKGHGIANIAQAMVDHFSTKGTLGVGLPGVKRMADEFEIKSEPGRGTKVSVKNGWITVLAEIKHGLAPELVLHLCTRCRQPLMLDAILLQALNPVLVASTMRW